jgi:uncharacterized protein YndB with AHSA1/START domain
MAKVLIQKTITINASADQVWRVFTDPAVTRKLGGEYVTEWIVGSDFGWKGRDGKMHTSGFVLQFEPQKILQHSLLDRENKGVKSVITYKLEETNGLTKLSAVEELHYGISAKEIEEINQGWDLALASVKEVAEKL